MTRNEWKSGWLFEEAKPLCRQCRRTIDRQGYLCHECLRVNRHKNKGRGPIEGFIVERGSDGTGQ
jgi:predicted amidophosphoribosyltransferase